VTPYPPIEHWLVPSGARRATLRAVRPAGRRGCESGAFWLGNRARTAAVSAVVLPSGPDVQERPDRWRVAAEVYGRISEWASERGLSLLAVVHTHVGDSVDLSGADRRRSVQAPGVLAVVIGHGGSERRWRRWGWSFYEDGDYRPLDHGELHRRVHFRPLRRCAIWRADAHRVTRLS
jgi:proteasome lid subunit RPN8/RPN11